MKLGAGIIAVVVVAVVAMLLIFGGDGPKLSSQDQPTATATVTAAAASSDSARVLGVRIGDGELQVTPTTVTRDGRMLGLAYENATGAAIEVVFARGAPKGAKAIQRELVTGAVIQAGQQRRDSVRVDPRRYTVLLRSPDETKPPTDTVSVEVR